jgi:iron transport multicopper oxidase
LSSGPDAANPLVYGTYSNPFVLNKDSIVDIVLNNDDKGKHPFHLHGHAFQVIYRSDEDAGHFNSNNHSAYPTSPTRRDTVAIRLGGNFVLRFKADNPGE